jgi:hypothetical protein
MLFSTAHLLRREYVNNKVKPDTFFTVRGGLLTEGEKARKVFRRQERFTPNFSLSWQKNLNIHHESE